MKKIWTSVLITAIVLAAAGIICGVAAYFNGGSIAELMENHQAKFVIEWLHPASMYQYYFGS
ncbi:MAG: hypothetical protein ACI3UZ_03630 [Oscillospiraceae bacterium]|nr:hypothetical protein [Oscillospiraceae bacterium]